MKVFIYLDENKQIKEFLTLETTRRGTTAGGVYVIWKCPESLNSGDIEDITAEFEFTNLEGTEIQETRPEGITTTVEFTNSELIDTKFFKANYQYKAANGYCVRLCKAEDINLASDLITQQTLLCVVNYIVNDSNDPSIIIPLAVDTGELVRLAEITKTQYNYLLSRISAISPERLIKVYDDFPGSPSAFEEGQIIFVRSEEKFYVQDGGTWEYIDLTNYDKVLKKVDGIKKITTTVGETDFINGQLAYLTNNNEQKLLKWNAYTSSFDVLFDFTDMSADIAELQEEIQHIKDKSDVVDVVGTYADLQAYDTTDLGDNDLIKVLSDETHSNKKAYYRYSKSTDSFTFVGVETEITEDDVEAIVEDKFNVVYANEKEVDGVYVPDLTSQQIYAIYLSVQGNQVVRVMTYSDTTRYYEVIGASNMATTLVCDGYIVEYFSFASGVEIRIRKGGAGAVSSVNGKTGEVVLTAQDIALENEETTIEDKFGEVDNTTDDLQDQISNLQNRGRYLSNWNATTGLPMTEPTTELPYEYRQGDYYIVGTVGTTNYKPTGSQYTGVASTSVETIELAVGDEYIYDGDEWVFQKNAPIDLDNYVDKTSDETITGVKAFQQEIHFKNASGNETFRIRANDNDLYIQWYNGSTLPILVRGDNPQFRTTLPQANNTYDLGSSAQKWKDLYLSGNLKLGNCDVGLDGTKLYLNSRTAGISTNGALIPVINATDDLGTSAKKWRNLYLIGKLSDGTNEIVVADIASKDYVDTKVATPVPSPASQANKVLRANASGTGLEYASISGGTQWYKHIIELKLGNSNMSKLWLLTTRSTQYTSFDEMKNDDTLTIHRFECGTASALTARIYGTVGINYKDTTSSELHILAFNSSTASADYYYYLRNLTDATSYTITAI